jgi:hypothetical protein
MKLKKKTVKKIQSKRKKLKDGIFFKKKEKKKPDLTD